MRYQDLDANAGTYNALRENSNSASVKLTWVKSWFAIVLDACGKVGIEQERLNKVPKGLQELESLIAAERRKATKNVLNAF
jgi:hypothetical protein